MNYEHSASEISDIKGANEELRYEWHFTKIAGPMRVRDRPPAEKLDRNSASVIVRRFGRKCPCSHGNVSSQPHVFTKSVPGIAQGRGDAIRDTSLRCFLGVLFNRYK